MSEQPSRFTPESEQPTHFAPESEKPIHFGPEIQPNIKPKRKGFIARFIQTALVLLVLLVTIVVGLYFYGSTLNQPANNFPTSQTVTIEQGSEVRSITEMLKLEGVVKSDTLLYYILVLFFDPTDIKASSYFFEEPLTTLEIAQRITQGDFDTDLLRFTHFEGERVTLLAERAEEVLPNFNREVFLREAVPLEGRLFPDTYFIPESYTDTELLTLLLTTHEEKMAELTEQIEASILTLDEILTLASIIEREANSPKSKKLVSSVLQNRLQSGMPLQADASIEYVLNKPLKELTPEDLKMESPYNTYLNRGLPPTPIGNPGLDAIMAVLEPTESNYFYYITDNEGEFHFASSYQQHLVNIEKYLR